MMTYRRQGPKKPSSAYFYPKKIAPFKGAFEQQVIYQILWQGVIILKAIQFQNVAHIEKTRFFRH